MSQKIIQAEMHDTMFIPDCGVGEVKKQLSTKDTGITKGTGITLKEGGLVYLDFPKKEGKGFVTIIVPASNFKYLRPDTTENK